MKVRAKKHKKRKDNTHAKAALSEAAWAITRSRNTVLATKFWKIASRQGKKKACIAIARKILVISYHILKTSRLGHLISNFQEFCNFLKARRDQMSVIIFTEKNQRLSVIKAFGHIVDPP